MADFFQFFSSWKLKLFVRHLYALFIILVEQSADITGIIGIAINSSRENVVNFLQMIDLD